MVVLKCKMCGRDINIIEGSSTIACENCGSIWIMSIAEIVNLGKGTINVSLDNPMLERAFLCIEDNDYNKADELLENVLNNNPLNSHAYLGKLFVTYKAKSISEMIDMLVKLNVNINEDKNYQKLIKFVSNVERSNYEIDVLDWPKEKIYREVEVARNTHDYKTARELYKQIEDYKDAKKVFEDCDKYERNKDYYIKETMYRIAREVFETKQVIEEESMTIYEVEKNFLLQEINAITAEWNIAKLHYETSVAAVEKEVFDQRQRLGLLGVLSFKKKKETIEDIKLLEFKLAKEKQKLSEINNIYGNRIKILNDRIKYLDNNKNNRFTPTYKNRGTILNLDDQEVKAVLVELYKGGKQKQFDIEIKLLRTIKNIREILHYFESKSIIIDEKSKEAYKDKFSKNKVITHTFYLINTKYLSLPYEYGTFNEYPDTLLQKWNEYCTYRKEKVEVQNNNIKIISQIYSRAINEAEKGDYPNAINIMVELENDYSIYSRSAELIEEWWGLYKAEEEQSMQKIIDEVELRVEKELE